MSVAQQLYTLDEYEQMTFDVPTELVRGELVPMPMPGAIHGRICGNVYFALESWNRQSDWGSVTSNDTGVATEFNPDTARGADVVAVRWDHLPDRQLPKGCFRTPPDLIVEVLSPSDRWNEVLAKVSEYLDAGVTEVWVVDHEDRSVDAFRINQRRRFLGEHAEITSPDLLPGFSCLVADFFRHV